MDKRVEIHVDAADGAIHLGSVAFLGGIALELTRQLLAGHQQGERDLGNGYLWLSVSDLLLGARPAGLSMCFKSGELEMITFGVALEDDELSEGWPTEQTSRRQVKFMQCEFERQLHVAFKMGGAKFSWGSAWSRFDPKGFMATAGVAYGR